MSRWVFSLIVKYGIIIHIDNQGGLGMDKRYQIFFSSTFADLEDERKGIMEAIMGLDCFPAGMEMFPATDSEQFEYIKTIIDESDYYVLIVAGRYGSLAEDGISYTEKEFDYAKQKGIPILTFVKKDIDSLPTGKTDQDDKKRKKLNLFRKKALDGRMGNFWDNADELKYKIQNSLMKEFKTHPRTGWVKGDTVPSYVALEQLTELKEENKKLNSKILNMQNLSQDNQDNQDNNELLTKSFTIYYELDDDEETVNDSCFSLMQIIEKVGLRLKCGLFYNELRIEINNKIMNLFSGYDYDAYITLDSLDKIIKNMLFANIIDIQDTNESSNPFLQLTEYGNRVFIRSIEF